MPGAIILILMSASFGVRWLVGVGALPRGMFDAHIDAGAIDFTGPWRTGVFERDQTIVLLHGGGPLVDVLLVHRSGRRARMLLSNHGAWKVLTVWGGESVREKP